MNITFTQNDLLRVKYQKAYATSRSNLLLAIALTLVSMVLMVTVQIGLTFSAYLPSSMVDQGKFILDIDNGVYTAEELGFTEEELQQYQETVDGTLEFAVNAVMAVVIVGAYFLCWALSKKHPVWLIIATVFYGIDTLLMIPDLLSFYFVVNVMGGLLLVLYHAWILYYLIAGINAAAKLKKLPLPMAPVEGMAVEVAPVEGAPVEETVSAESDNNTPEV